MQKPRENGTLQLPPGKWLSWGQGLLLLTALYPAHQEARPLLVLRFITVIVGNLASYMCIPETEVACSGLLLHSQNIRGKQETKEQQSLYLLGEVPLFWDWGLNSGLHT
jgi:hypothetical protein